MWMHITHTYVYTDSAHTQCMWIGSVKHKPYSFIQIHAHLRTHACTQHKQHSTTTKNLHVQTNKCDLRFGSIDLFLFWPIWCTNYAMLTQTHLMNFTPMRVHVYTSCCESVCVRINVGFQLQFKCMLVCCIHKSEAYNDKPMHSIKRHVFNYNN